MTFHYVNLISWRFVSDKDGTNASFFCDSISMKVLTLCLTGKKLKRNSGVSAYHSLKNIKSNRINLLAHRAVNMEGKNYVLPRNLSKFDPTQFKEIPWQTVDTVFIGISSPKQDRLAYELASAFPHLGIYCFGAAMYTSTNTGDRLGMNWLIMAINNPKRFFVKILRTYREIISIVTDTDQRIKYRKFVNQFSNE